MEIHLDSGGQVPVTGECMSPGLPEGARVRIERCPPGRLLPGDMVLLERGGAFVLHRYLASVRVAGRRRLLAKSDRALRPDAPWPPEDLLGRVVAVVREVGTSRHPDDAAGEDAASAGPEDAASAPGAALRPYRPALLDRLRSAALGLFWGSVFPFIKEARECLWAARRSNSR